MVVVRPFGPWSQRGPHTRHAGVPYRKVAPFLTQPRQLQQAPGPGCHLSGPGRRGLRAGMSPSGNVYLFLPSQGQGRTVRRLRTAEGPPAITLRGTFEPAGWRTHPMASPGGTSLRILARSHLDPRRGGTVCDQGPPVGAHLAGPAPSVTRITGTCVPALRGPGRGRSAQLDLPGVQKGQIAHLGRQKPPESELAVAAHGGASQRHTTGAVYGRLRTSWDGDGPCGLNSSVGGHTVQNKQTKQNKHPSLAGEILHLSCRC